ncbi:MAG: cytochrome b N-terminal domain-containing protein [Candidatus Tectomicrobia bacterium]|nr:cytochrome b N-terminal domain-containing protein [Candidatus Tectomicrobia bacterium]
MDAPPAASTRRGRQRLRERLLDGFEGRTGLLRFWHLQRQHTVPAKLPWYYYLGSLLLLFAAIQVATGILLLLYYEPTPSAAHESVARIISEVRFGWIVRSLHYWSSHAMVATLLLHLARVFLTASFKRPRELTWMLGVGLLLTVLGFAFTGYLLPWEQAAFWGTTVGSGIAGQAPWLGPFLKAMLRGGAQVGGATLTRFFALHVMLLPAALLVLLAAHLALVWKHGPSEPLARLAGTGAARDRRVRFFPVQARKEAAVACFVFAALLLWVAWRAAPLGDPADPLRTPEHVKPEWYFLFSYQALKYIPSRALPGGISTFQVAVLAQALPLLALLLWPYLERSPERRWRRRRAALSLFFLALLALLVLTYLGVYAGKTEPIFGIAVS